MAPVMDSVDVTRDAKARLVEHEQIDDDDDGMQDVSPMEDGRLEVKEEGIDLPARRAPTMHDLSLRSNEPRKTSLRGGRDGMMFERSGAPSPPSRLWPSPAIRPNRKVWVVVQEDLDPQRTTVQVSNFVVQVLASYHTKRAAIETADVIAKSHAGPDNPRWSALGDGKHRIVRTGSRLTADPAPYIKIWVESTTLSEGKGVTG